MPAENSCTNCGVPISETPEEDGFHPAQELVMDEDDEPHCAACADDDRRHTGDQIARAAKVDADDEELAQMLASELYAEELRRWMSANGLTRSRGARKLQSAREAVEQDRVLVAAAVDSVKDLVEDEPHTAICTCGFEQHFADEEAAVEAAKEHKSENPEHFPKAWGNGERRLYG